MKDPNCLVDHGNNPCNCFINSLCEKYPAVAFNGALENDIGKEIDRLNSENKRLQSELTKCLDWDTKDLWLRELSQYRAERDEAIEMLSRIDSLYGGKTSIRERVGLKEFISRMKP